MAAQGKAGVRPRREEALGVLSAPAKHAAQHDDSNGAVARSQFNERDDRRLIDRFLHNLMVALGASSV
jgi:hypothetical protein